MALIYGLDMFLLHLLHNDEGHLIHDPFVVDVLQIKSLPFSYKDECVDKI